MSVNKYQPHVFVLPEDDANRQLANGFLLDLSLSTKKIQVLPEVGGWAQVLERFQSDHIPGMDRYPERYMVLLIDFDNRPDRLDHARAAIPGHLTERVFILGVLSEPEALRRTLSNLTKRLDWRWRRIVAPKLRSFGGTTSSDTMPVS